MIDFEMITSMDLRPGDKIIFPSETGIATIAEISYHDFRKGWKGEIILGLEGTDGVMVYEGDWVARVNAPAERTDP